MVNNSTNINKMNNHLSPKESLNIDGQQFYQYQQNKQSLLLILVELLTITVYTFFRWEVIVCFADTGRIVDHHCLYFL
jgi:hypothetical protein